ncbi:MAG: iron uptake porin [Prochlorococcus marinus CUG1431]|uniref:Iron uptake porin n=1 Tax=Prochlorococcus marinus CUG1433 TaxID=2774506 RepID=A0A9D9BWU9_PROMR|nr:iron uptake porin [Prochlorococcus marinus CUG1433]MBO6981299.1 iron uptake porin [Prochlorococcus marinus CUG1431]
MKLFQQMLVAGASLGFIAPIAVQASDIVNLEEMDSYALSQKRSSRLDSKSFINEVSEDIAKLKGRVDGLEARQNQFEAGGFSDTTTMDGKAVFTLMGTDHNLSAATKDDSVTAAYMLQMNLNTSFTGDDNLYIRLKSGNHAGNSVTKTYGTYLSSGNGNADVLKVDKIWYEFPVGDKNTFWIGPKIENYYMHGTTPSIYKPVTKQFTLGGNGEAYGASTNSGVGWAYKADNGFAVSSNVVSQQNGTTNGFITNESATSWANQVGYTTDQWSVSAIVNSKTNGWSDTYYHTANHAPTGNDSFTSIGLRSWWRPADTGTKTPSISLGFDSTSYDGAPAASDSSSAWFAGLTWEDMFQADDRIGIAFGQPTTNENESTVDPFAYELYYSFKTNESVTITPAIFGGSDRNGTSRDDVFGAVLETTLKF